jgi:hypothetical protein
MREHWMNMSPEERADLMNKMQERWKNMPPDELAARRLRMRERFENMTPEERKQFSMDMQSGMLPAEQSRKN